MKEINIGQATAITSPNPLVLVCTKKENGIFINHQSPPGEPRVVHYAERSFRNIPPDGGFIRRPVVEDGGHHLDQALPRVKDAPGIGCGKDDSTWG